MTETHAQTDAQPPEPPERECHVRPEDIKKIGGAQSIDDKVETWQRQLEAQESQGSLGDRNFAYYATLIIAFIVGSLMSGFSAGGGGGGNVLIGLLAAAPWRWW
jgi:hypothetical protein